MSKFKGLKDTIIALLLGFVVAKVIIPLFLIVGYVPSGSMIPTLEIKDRLICTNAFWHTLEHGDIVVFKPNIEEGSDSYFIKRLIGEPGDKIKIQHGKVFRNGEELEEPYVQSSLDYSGSFTVPKDKYFVLGDNRGDSLDARFWENPFIGKDQIDYVANLRIYPFNKMTIFKHWFDTLFLPHIVGWKYN